MKHFSTALLISCLALASSNVSAQLPSYVPTNGLVGWYPFSGNTKDSSGNGYNAYNNGFAVLTTDRFNNPNAAYSFNGSNAHIDAQFNGITNPKRYTVSAWFKTSADSLAGIAALRPASNYPSFYGLRTKNSVVYGTYMTSTAVPEVGEAFSKNAWKFAAITFDSLMARVYVDGVIMDSIAVTEPIQPISNPELTIGTWVTAPPIKHNFFTGSTDEVGVWSRALNYTEIKQLYYNSLTIPTGLEATKTPSKSVVVNPIGESLIINCPISGQAPSVYTVIDLNGKVVLSGKLYGGLNVISTGLLGPGVYFVRLQDEVVRVVKP